MDTRGLRGGDVERSIADVGGLVRIDVEPVERDQDLVGMGLPARRLVRADDDVHQVAEPERLERELDDVVPLRADDPELPPFAVQPFEQLEHPGKRLELGVERLVEVAVRLGQFGRLLLVEGAHLLLEVTAPDLRHQHVVGEFTAEHGLGRVTVGREDHPAGVDDRAVEIEEDDGEAHLPDANDAAVPSDHVQESG